MQEAHIHLKDKDHEIKITILERKEGQPYGMDDNYDLPVRLEYKSKKENFIKEPVYLETYELAYFYCSLDDISIGSIVEQGFSFAEPYISFLLKNINGRILFTLCYKENEEDQITIKISQKFNQREFGELIEKVHQGCNLWIDDSELIEFREYLDDGYYDSPSGYRVAEVEYANSIGKYYSYLCDDESIKTGDLVVVPGFFGREAVVRVLDIDFYSEDELPCSLDKMKRVVKKYIKPMSKKISLCKWDITESGLGFELLVNIVIKRKEKVEFLVKDKNAYYNVYLNEYKDVYLDVYKEMLSLKPNEMKITKGLWLTAEKVLHIGLVEKKKDFILFFNNILNKAKELKKHYVGIPCILKKYRGISPETMFKIALKTVKEWIMQNENYDMEVLFCCPNEKLYKKFKRVYRREIEQKCIN